MKPIMNFFKYLFLSHEVPIDDSSKEDQNNTNTNNDMQLETSGLGCLSKSLKSILGFASEQKCLLQITSQWKLFQLGI